jgi:hypothetical protein
LSASSLRSWETGAATRSEDRLFAEADRQLTDQRLTADGLASRAGFMISASALGAGILGSRLPTLRSNWTIPALVTLGLAVLIGATVLIPALLAGPTPSTLQAWLGEQARTRMKALYAAKIAVLESNRTRLTVMRVLLCGQGLTVIVAIVLVVVAASGDARGK